MTQIEKVLRELRQNRKSGVSSFWGYQNYIPRIGALIFLLKKKGYKIVSIDNKKDSGCTYFLRFVPDELKIKGDKLAEFLYRKCENKN